MKDDLFRKKKHKSTQNTDTSSLVPLPWQRLTACTGKDSIQYYVWPFERMDTQTHPLTKRGSLNSFYRENLGCLKIQTQKKAPESNTHFHHQQGWSILCHGFLWIPQGVKTQTAQNWDPQAQKYSIPQRGQATWPRPLRARIWRLHCSHFWTTEEGREDEYSDPDGLTRSLPLPGEGSCSNCEKDLEIPLHVSGLPNLNINSHHQWMPSTGDIHPHDKRVDRHSGR